MLHSFDTVAWASGPATKIQSNSTYRNSGKIGRLNKKILLVVKSKGDMLEQLRTDY